MRKNGIALLLLILCITLICGCSAQKAVNDENKVTDIEKIPETQIKYNKYDTSGIKSLSPESDSNIQAIKKLIEDTNKAYFDIDVSNSNKSHEDISKYLAKGVVYDTYARASMYKKYDVKMHCMRTDIEQVNYDADNDKYMVKADIYLYVDNYDGLNGKKQIFKTDEYLVLSKEDSSFKINSYYIFDELIKAGEGKKPYIISTAKGNFYSSEDYKNIKGVEQLVQNYAKLIYYKNYTDQDYKPKFSKILDYYSNELKAKEKDMVNNRVKSQLEYSAMQNLEKIDMEKVICCEKDKKYKVMAKAYVNLSQQKYKDGDNLYEEKYIQYFYVDVINENGEFKLSNIHGLVNLVYSKKDKK